MSDYSNMVWSHNPWSRRGGNYGDGAGAGVFNFNNTNGNANGDRSFRLVLLTTKEKILFVESIQNTKKREGIVRGELPSFIQKKFYVK